MRSILHFGRLIRWPQRIALPLVSITVLGSWTTHKRVGPPAVAVASPYSHVLSSGSFALPNGAKVLDCLVLNDSPNAQQVRITLYKVLINVPKTIVGSPFTTTIPANSSTHNSFTVGTNVPVGETFEAVVEMNDTRVLPVIDVWSASMPVIIPGTHLSPRDFTDVR
jgi:hypothetical protein